MTTLSLSAPHQGRPIVKPGTLLALWTGLRAHYARRALKQRETRFDHAMADIYMTATTGGTPQRSARAA
ncbi:hypothetical protein [Shimia sp. Alg240-R146]|uniref:hypothetical protein n=1 Tax=Shimia sp. Alg240-R146 TaxID=2993449 RepID=UPI0022DFF462|nr:hypothetical protein [Shimia sp. Alg240-R146]